MNYKFKLQNSWQLILIAAVIFLSIKFSYIPWVYDLRIGLIVVVVGGIIFFRMKSKFVKAKLGTKGVSAKARILEVTETGHYDSMYNPRVKLVLEVMPANQPAYQAKYSDFFSKLELHKLEPGNVIWVKYNPDNPKEVILDSGGGNESMEQVFQKFAANSSSGTGNSMAETVNVSLNGSQAFSEETIAEIQQFTQMQADLMLYGVEATAIVLRSWTTGVMINETNPMMGFELEVHPVGHPTFTADAKAPVLLQNSHKFQPGQKVKVRYDPTNVQRITVAGSL